MNPWTEAHDTVVNWRSKYPVIKDGSDQHAPPNHLEGLLRQEVVETEAEHLLESTLLYNFVDHAKELIDVVVFLFSFCARHNIMPDFIEAWSRANGQGARSPIYDQLKEKALNIGTGNVEKNVNDFLMYVISLSHHMPQPLDVVQIMELVIEKNTANRHPNYYTAYDNQGKHLDSQELVEKYYHVEKMLRFLRNYYGATLESWMHEPHAHLIVDFRNSDTAFATLKKTVIDQKIIMVHQLSALLKGEGEFGFAESQLSYALQSAGGVLLKESAA